MDLEELEEMDASEIPAESSIRERWSYLKMVKFAISQSQIK